MENTGESVDIDAIYIEGKYPDKNWNLVEFLIEKDCIPDKETAIKVAEIYLLIEKRSDESLNHSFIPTEVFYDIEEMVWIVSFSPYQNGKPIPGNSYSIALRKKNAEVLKMWVD